MPGNKVTVEVAAERLGTTPAAIRMRLSRGTLQGEKRDGRHWIVEMPDEGTEQTTRERTTHNTPREPARERRAFDDVEREELITLRATNAMLADERNRLLIDLADERNQRKYEFERLTQMVKMIEQHVPIPSVKKDLPEEEKPVIIVEEMPSERQVDLPTPLPEMPRIPPPPPPRPWWKRWVR